MSSKDRLRRFCLMLCYSGKQYSGMQRNPGAETIEECLLKALKESSFINEQQYVRPQLAYFQRAARTDKHVSAIRQIVSIKLRESVVQHIQSINQHLPKDIRLMGAKRVTGAFDAKNHCDARTYSYLMPSFALAPVAEVTQENYRVTSEVLELFNTTLRHYGGSHSFHNFTQGKKFSEASSTRVIRYMNCSEPFYPCNQNEVEFVLIRVKGQSFMMHQIRKMIGLAIAVVKGYATENHLKKSLEEPYMDIPKAPGLGLMLEEVHFTRYNQKFGGDGHHEPIEWEEQNDEIDKFRNEHIYPVIVETELKEKSMLTWLQTLSLHSYGKNKTSPRTKSSPNLELILRSHNTLHTEDVDSQFDDDKNCPDRKRVKLEANSTEDLETRVEPTKDPRVKVEISDASETKAGTNDLDIKAESADDSDSKVELSVDHEEKTTTTEDIKIKIERAT